MRDFSFPSLGSGFLAAPRRFQKAGILLSEEIGASDAVEAYGGITAGIARLGSNGWLAPLRFDAPFRGTRNYLLLSRANGGFELPDGAEIIFDDGALLDFSGYGDVTADATSGSTGRKTIFDAEGSLGTGRLLASNATAGSATVTVATGLGVNFSRGMDCIIASDDLFTTMDSAATATVGERVIVESVSSDTITLKGELFGTYNTADNATLYPVNSVKLKVRNPRIIGPGRPTGNFRGDKAIRALYGRDCLVEGGLIQRCDLAAVDFDAVLNGTIKDVTAVQDGVGANNEVAFCFLMEDGCDSVTVMNCSTYGSNQPYDVSGSGGLGIARRIKLVNNRAKGARSSAYALHDSQEIIEIDGNEADSCENGVDCRGGNVRITNNRFRNLGTGLGNLGCGVQLREKAVNIHIANNWVDGCIRGVYFISDDDAAAEGDPSNIQIVDNHFLNVTSGFSGVLLEYQNSINALTGIAIKRNTIKLLGTAIGIDLRGTFEFPEITDNSITGGTGRSIVLRAGDSVTPGPGTAGEGPISPIVRRNIIGETNLGVLIQHETGQVNVGDNFQQGSHIFETIGTDNEFTVSVLGSAREIRHTGTLTANRAVTLSTTDAHRGATIKFTRTGSGAFTLDIGTGPLKSLATDEWCTVTYNGAGWYLSAFGAL